MDTRRVLCVILWVGLSAGSVRGLDWQRLHAEADERKWQEVTEAERAGVQGAERLYVLGLRALTAHEDEAAGLLFERMLAGDEGSVEAKWGMAEVARRQYARERSEALLDKVLSLQPDFSPALLTLAYLRFTQGRFKDALKLAHGVVGRGEAVTDRTNYARALVMEAGSRGMIADRGGLVAKLRHGTRVHGKLKRAEKVCPDSPEVLVGLGSFYLLAPRIAGGDLDKAIKHLEKAVAADPRMAEAHARLSQAYTAAGQPGRARESLKKALEIDPRNALTKELDK